MQFVEMDDLGSKAIQIFERGWPSHVDSVLPDGSLLGARSDVVMGVPAGVQIRPPGYEAWSRFERIELNVAEDVSSRYYAFLQGELGKPYDKTAIAAFPLRRDWRETGSWFCSELACAALEASGFFPKPLGEDANHITPRDLLLIVSPWRT